MLTNIYPIVVNAGTKKNIFSFGSGEQHGWAKDRGHREGGNEELLLPRIKGVRGKLWFSLNAWTPIKSLSLRRRRPSRLSELLHAVVKGF